MSNEYCSNCIKYCKTNSKLDLIGYSSKSDLTVGQKLENKGVDSLQFAPAGSYPASPIVTICGLATSYKALQKINRMSEELGLAQSCLEAVYCGPMSTNLSLLLQALNIHAFFKEDIQLLLDGQRRPISSLGSRDFGKSGVFKEVPHNLQLTQSTCCWHENGISRFKPEWWEYSEDCRSKGYFRHLVKSFLLSESSRVFILLGVNNSNQSIVADLIYSLGLSKEVGLFSPDNFDNNESSWNRKYEKLVFSIHHPANTGFIYNNFRASSKSLLYNYYENNSWEFDACSYGNISLEHMVSCKEYYSFLSRYVPEICIG